MSWSIHKLDKSLGEFRERWDSLNASLWQGNPYYDSRFIEPLLQHFGSGRERLCLYRQGGEESMLIVAPKGRGRWVTFLTSQAQVAPLLLRDPEVLRSLLPRLGPGALMLDLLCQDPEYGPLRSVPSKGQWISMPHARTMRVNVAAGFDEYWAARPGSVRQNVGRRLRKLKDGGVHCDMQIIELPDAMPAAVATFGEIESRGWKGQQGTAIHAGNVQGRFYSDVLSRFASTGRTCVYQLNLNGEIAAMRLAILSSTMLVSLKTTYDERFADHSPGRLLLYLALKHEFERRRVQTIEFYTNADENQLAWGSEDRWISNIMLFRSWPVAAGYRLLQALKTSGNPAEASSLH